MLEVLVEVLTLLSLQASADTSCILAGWNIADLRCCAPSKAFRCWPSYKKVA